MIKIENHLRKYLEPGIKPEIIDPLDLLSLDRIDIGIKLGFIKYYIQGNSDYEKQKWKSIYLEHIKSFHNGKYLEPYSWKKNAEDFIKSFIELFNCIKQKGFDASNSIIPVDQNNIPINGAHRIACCIFLNKEVEIVRLSVNGVKYNYDFYKYRLENEYLIHGVIEICSYKNKMRVGVIWPRKSKELCDSDELKPNIIYSKKLSHKQLLLTVGFIYNKDHWVLNDINNSKTISIENKTNKVFHSKNETHFFIKEYESLQRTNDDKEQIRKKVGVGKHSVHICDSIEESLGILNLLKDEKDIFSIYEYIDIDRYFKLTNQFNNLFVSNPVAISGSATIYLTGGRKMNDLDLYSLKETDGKIYHNSHLKSYNISEEEILDYITPIFNLKFLALRTIKKLKVLRNEPKDKIDLIHISKIIENQKKSHKFKYYMNYIRIFISNIKMNIRMVLIRLLEIFGVKNMLKRLLKSSK